MNSQDLEPEAENILKTGKHADALSHIPPLYSIAISLKRIADVLEGAPDRYGIFNLLSDISQNMANRG